MSGADVPDRPEGADGADRVISAGPPAGSRGVPPTVSPMTDVVSERSEASPATEDAPTRRARRERAHEPAHAGAPVAGAPADGADAHDRLLTAQDVRDARFHATRDVPGYDQREVDAFLELVEITLRRLHAERAAWTASGEGLPQPSPAPGAELLVAPAAPVEPHDDASAQQGPQVGDEPTATTTGDAEAADAAPADPDPADADPLTGPLPVSSLPAWSVLDATDDAAPQDATDLAEAPAGTGTDEPGEPASGTTDDEPGAAADLDVTAEVPAVPSREPEGTTEADAEPVGVLEPGAPQDETPRDEAPSEEAPQDEAQHDEAPSEAPVALVEEPAEAPPVAPVAPVAPAPPGLAEPSDDETTVLPAPIPALEDEPEPVVPSTSSAHGAEAAHEPDELLTGRVVRQARFPIVTDGLGYVVGEIDDFLDRVAESLDQADMGIPPDLDRHDVETARFPTTWRGGYDQDAVDELLDRAARSLPERRNRG